MIDKMGIEVKQGKVTVGETYPLYGIITRIVDDMPGCTTIEINNQVLAHISVSNEYLELLKKRAFEPAIFIAKITRCEPIECECSTIIFGKPANMAA